jgi:hypothetical protein
MAKAKARRIPFSRIGNVQTWGPFTNGKSVSIDADACTAEIRHNAMLHGFKQKCGDSMALEYKQADGTTRAPTEDEKFELISGVANNLHNGLWNGGREPTGGILYQALNRLKPEEISSVDKMNAWLAKTAAARNITVKTLVAKLETQPGTIKDTIDEIKLEIAGDTEIDSDELLANLE